MTVQTFPPGRLRRDPMTHKWTVIAPVRRNAAQVGPDRGAGLPTLFGPCPFCPGNEHLTEAPVFELSGQGRWLVRIIPNRFPIVMSREVADTAPAPAGDAIDRGSHAKEAAPVGSLLFEEESAFGLHEVVVESPRHDEDLADYDDDQLDLVFRAYRDRIAALERVPGIRVVSAFRNRGRRAGSSQPHPHGQIMAMSFAGSEVELRSRIAEAHHRETGRVLMQDVVAHELTTGVRVVLATERSVWLVPYAPRASLESWVVARHAESFASMAEDSLAHFARMIRRAAHTLRSVSGGSDYNVIFRLPRVGASPGERFVYAEIIPRGAPGAGFELTQGASVVSVTPEEVAALLKKATA